MVIHADRRCETHRSFLAGSVVHEMVNVYDVAQWFHDTTSDIRLETLCRLLDCCMPLELQFLNSYLQELLGRNLVLNQQCESHMPELREITDSSCRRQLCILLTRLKSANLLANSIYNILIQYNFSDFFSRVISMEEELVDELLLLFTLAANHPAMTFAQRRNLHQRLADLRETIEKSFKVEFKCYQADVCSQHSQEFVCKPIKNSNTLAPNLKDPCNIKESSKTDSSVKPTVCFPSKDVAVKNISKVHIKDLRVVRVQQRSLDKKYEYIFEVTWSNGKVVRIHRAYGELFDFQCKFRRRYSRERCRTGRKIIPYLPPRKPIRSCKGNEILPDITHYVREFTKLPENLLHCDSVESFFSDDAEKVIDEKQDRRKCAQQCSSHVKKDSAKITCKTTDASRVSLEEKANKESGTTRTHSPREKSSSSLSNKLQHKSSQNFGKSESRKPTLNPQLNATGLATDYERKTTDVNDCAKALVCSRSLETISKVQGVVQETGTTLSLLDEKTLQICDIQQQNSEETNSTVDEFKTVHGNANENAMSRDTTANTAANGAHGVLRTVSCTNTSSDPATMTSLSSAATSCQFLLKTNQGPSVLTSSTQTMKSSASFVSLPMSTATMPCVSSAMTFSSTLTSSTVTVSTCVSITSITSSQAPLTVAVPASSPLCTTCSISYQSSSSSSMTSSLSLSPVIEESMSTSCSYDKEQFDFLPSTSLSSTKKNLVLSFLHGQAFNYSNSEIEKMELSDVEKQKMKTVNECLKSSRKNGYTSNGHHYLPQHGLLIVPNGYIHPHSCDLESPDDIANSTLPYDLSAFYLNGTDTQNADKNSNFIFQNGGHNSTNDWNETSEFKHKSYVHEKSNGFAKLYCYNCGRDGHAGSSCVEKKEDSIIS